MTKESVGKVRQFTSAYVEVWLALLRLTLKSAAFVSIAVILPVVLLAPMLIGIVVQFGFPPETSWGEQLDAVWLVANIVWALLLMTTTLALIEVYYDD